MRRFLFPVLMLAIALLLPACTANPRQDPAWGNLRVTLDDIRHTETQWSANLTITNPTDKMQALQYQGAARYTLVVTREGKEILRQNFDPIAPGQPALLNLAAGVAKKHPVVWTFRDNQGNRVEPGTYQASVTLNAITRVPNPNRQAGEPAEQVVEPKTVGPVTIVVK